MEKSEKPTPKETPPNDSIKLLIREEVERRFDAPTASFVKLVEEEVRQRIKRQEYFYYVIIALLLGAFFMFWHIQLSEVPDVIHKQLATEGSLAAQKQITDILSDAKDRNGDLSNVLASAKSTAEDVKSNLNDLVVSAKATADSVNNDLIGISTSVNTNLLSPYRTRLNQLKDKDNFILVDDLPKLFVVEAVTNLVDGQKIILDYEPIFQTVRIRGGSGLQSIPHSLDGVASLDGNTITITNQNDSWLRSLPNWIQNGSFRVEYVRKSPR